MKSRLAYLSAVALLTVSGVVYGAKGEHKDDHTPKHGGVVIETKSMDFEIVVKPDLVQVYLRDHGKAIKLDNAAGKLTLLNGNEKQEVALKPVGEKLEAKGVFKPGLGVRGIVQATIAGKSHVARFVLK